MTRKAVQRQQLVGTWMLETFHARELSSGLIRYPLGERPAGMILYTDDGYMSAQLASSPAADDYIAYGGGYDLDEDAGVVHHAIAMSSMPELLLAPQYRNARIDADLLTLSATTTDADGLSLESTLVWRRTQPQTEGS